MSVINSAWATSLSGPSCGLKRLESAVSVYGAAAPWAIRNKNALVVSGRRLGTIVPGKRADLTVLAGDPLDVEKLASRVRAVYQAGELVANAAGSAD